MRAITYVTVAVALLSATPGFAQSDAGVEERLAFLEERLDASQKHGMWWQWGWMGVSAGGLVASTAMAVTDHGEERVNDIVEATKGGIGVVYLTVAPLKARLGAHPIRELPSGTPDERETQLRAAEKLLEANALRAQERTDWKMYAGNTVLEGIGLGIDLGWGKKPGAWVNFAAGMVAGSFQIWSAPARPLTDWEEYQQRFGGETVSKAEWWISPNRDLNGLAFHYRW